MFDQTNPTLPTFPASIDVTNAFFSTTAYNQPNVWPPLNISYLGASGLTTFFPGNVAPPSSDMFNFIAETAALYVRLAAYSSYAYTPTNLFGAVGDTWYDPRINFGEECAPYMLSGQIRAGNAPVEIVVPTQCNVNLKGDGNQPGCAGVNSQELKYFFSFGNEEYGSIFYFLFFDF
jgi:hypothetical protein